MIVELKQHVAALENAAVLQVFARYQVKKFNQPGANG